jgi:hypothetical protein
MLHRHHQLLAVLSGAKRVPVQVRELVKRSRYLMALAHLWQLNSAPQSYLSSAGLSGMFLFFNGGTRSPGTGTDVELLGSHQNKI